LSKIRALVRTAGKRVVTPVTHAIGRIGGRDYFEDFVRVYPDEIAYNRLGRRRRFTRTDALVFESHRRFYEFAAQFVEGRRVADVGCGSGYGTKILGDAGAASIAATDVSRKALAFAETHFGAYATFTRQSITSLEAYADESFDVVVCSEVLEHVREYGSEGRAVDELRRILRPGGLAVVGTPNAELLGDHGFPFDEIHELFEPRFERFLIYENALVPFTAEARAAWEGRLREGRVGVVLSQTVREAVAPDGATAVLKEGDPPGRRRFGDYDVDETLLRNTHSWVVLARRATRPAADAAA
jgi:SAM-dependent methyltransferase